VQSSFSCAESAPAAAAVSHRRRADYLRDQVAANRAVPEYQIAQVTNSSSFTIQGWTVGDATVAALELSAGLIDNPTTGTIDPEAVNSTTRYYRVTSPQP
jgi:hypothetical protein